VISATFIFFRKKINIFIPISFGSSQLIFIFVRKFTFMTEEQSKLISVFESRVRRLMQICDALKQENSDLKLQIEAMQQSQNELEEANKTIKVKYDNLKMARIISVRQDDLKGAKNRLSKLVKEVDKCIALLNE
jgi:glycerol-3-phosphate responsive antiterminator